MGERRGARLAGPPWFEAGAHRSVHETLRRPRRKSQKVGEAKFGWDAPVGISKSPFEMFSNSWMRLEPSKGTRPDVARKSVTPLAHTSTLNPENCCEPDATSGGWKAGLPRDFEHVSSCAYLRHDGEGGVGAGGGGGARGGGGGVAAAAAAAGAAGCAART